MIREGKRQTGRYSGRILPLLRLGRWRLSTLLLTMGIVAVWTQAGIIARQNFRLRREIDVMRVLAAELHIQDPLQYAVIKEQSRWHDENVWRVFLPAGTHHSIQLATRDIGDDNFPAAMQSASLPAGEHQIGYRTAKQADQSWQVLVLVDGKPTLDFREDADWETSPSYISNGGYTQSTQQSTNLPLVLQRLRFRRLDPQSRFSPADPEANGILVWISTSD